MLTEEAQQHKNNNRFRCSECKTVFCSSCNAIPYHLGSTCEQFASNATGRHCRFCDVKLNENNTAPDMVLNLIELMSGISCFT